MGSKRASCMCTGTCFALKGACVWGGRRVCVCACVLAGWWFRTRAPVCSCEAQRGTSPHAHTHTHTHARRAHLQLWPVCRGRRLQPFCALLGGSLGGGGICRPHLEAEWLHARRQQRQVPWMCASACACACACACECEAVSSGKPWAVLRTKRWVRVSAPHVRRACTAHVHAPAAHHTPSARGSSLALTSRARARAARPAPP
jgi:hypothetical protein